MSLLRVLLALCLALSVQAFTLPAAPLATAAATATPAAITMGRGDRRTAKGKRKAKSFGVFRPRNAELRKRAAAQLCHGMACDCTLRFRIAAWSACRRS